MVTTFQSNPDLELKINYLNYSGSFTVTPKNHFLSQINPAQTVHFFLYLCLSYHQKMGVFTSTTVTTWNVLVHVLLNHDFVILTSRFIMGIRSKFTSWKWNDLSMDLLLSKNWKRNESLQKTNRLPKNAGVCTNVCLSGVFVFVPAFYLLITNLYNVQPHECSYISCSDRAIYGALCFFVRPLTSLIHPHCFTFLNRKWHWITDPYFLFILPMHLLRNILFVSRTWICLLIHIGRL